MSIYKFKISRSLSYATMKLKFTQLACKIIFFYCTWTLVSCSISYPIHSQKDAAKSSQRFDWRHISFDLELRSPLNHIEQTFVKEINSDGRVNFNVYDIVNLKSEDFLLENLVYLLLDGKPIKIVPETKENNLRTIDQLSNGITADPTNISMVNGYAPNNQQVTRLKYQLTPAIVDQIMISKEIAFQYYSGPSILTVRFTPNKMRSLKMLLAKDA